MWSSRASTQTRNKTYLAQSAVSGQLLGTETKAGNPALPVVRAIGFALEGALTRWTEGANRWADDNETIDNEFSQLRYRARKMIANAQFTMSHPIHTYEGFKSLSLN
jgi:hypothetical protein